MTGPTPERLDSLLSRLTDELDEASAGLRVTREWKAVKSVVDDHAERRDALVAEAESLEDAIRTLEAQGDLLALARDEVAEADRHAALERNRREKEDKQILAIVRGFLRPYSLLAVFAVVAGPAIGLVFREWALFGALPAILGFLEMRRRRQLMQGRAWVILNDEVQELEARVRMYDLIAGVATAVAVVWFVAALATGGQP